MTFCNLVAIEIIESSRVLRNSISTCYTYLLMELASTNLLLSFIYLWRQHKTTAVGRPRYLQTDYFLAPGLLGMLGDPTQ